MKEVLILIIAITYIVLCAIKNWGRKYSYIGIRRDLIRKDLTKEERCRIIFENIFGVSFERCRPNFLKNPKTGKNLELDGYNSTIITPLGMGLAFEYNGEQHYTYVPKFHKSPEDLIDQQERDRLKVALCKKNKVLLITIPYNIPISDLESYIKRKIYLEGVYYY